MANSSINNKPISEGFISSLSEINPTAVKKNVSLAEFSRWKVGGVAKCIFTPHSVEELAKVVRLANEAEQPFIVIGSTSNLLFSDEGLDILAIHLGNPLSDITFNASKVTVEAGVWVPGLARKLASKGLSGLEHTAGIPGTLGGLICMNGGSMRRGIGENVVTVKSLTKDGTIKVYTKDECLFAYRTSIFQSNNEIILEATLQLENADSKLIKQQMLAILRSRRRKFPLKLPNCGSVFVSNPAMYEEFGPPGAVIEKCGLKGKTIGGAQISPLHANFIINKGTATAIDILSLISLVCNKVKLETGYHMVSEVRFVENNGVTLPAADKKIYE
ncbi:UDP-N-acetylmuramate dehydrogenase [Pseudoalteromonas sp. P1-25]|uniref:UDP-N-acetylmuramate dehydrogenase n=1 Tax=Pseudoalteromonas sp. P1-25 TaxID=1723758 RepID=UPI0006E550BA|nr:UDP-N-acetylmuramate dehydrogenase [Pseudoalteromonas sp. P1-25]KPZ51751.1 UDP-N-acetylenolpyruvoylglucosamine reductase [Pseudoalteromonas sp. P1-25]